MVAPILTCFRLRNHARSGHVHARFSAIERHYKLGENASARSIRYYNEKTAMGCHVMWQDYENESYARCIETEDRIVVCVYYAFGFSKALSRKGTDNLIIRLANTLRRNPNSVLKLTPPFMLMDFEKASSQIRFYTDVVAYSRSYRLENEAGFALANRCFSPFYALLAEPKPSEMGWAAEQLNGYMYGEYAPLEGLMRNGPGYSAVITPDRIDHGESSLVSKFFTDKTGDVYRGLNRLASETQRLGAFDEVDLAITGGRDSRMTAAFGVSKFAEKARCRTSHPPALERTIATQLMERTAEFSRYENDNLIVRADGTPLWRGSPRKTPERADIIQRGKDWAYAHEGVGISSALYNNCSMKIPFPEAESHSSISVSGAGGEIAKAYAYRPMQVSGVFARNQKAWLEEIKTVGAHLRLETHPTTGFGAVHFVKEEYKPILADYFSRQYSKAQDMGAFGYRFFDYWYLVGRMAGSHSAGLQHAQNLFPFLVPEVIAASVQDTFERKINVQLSRDIVAHYQPSWSEVPYFDEIQNEVPRSEITFFQKQEYLWSGPAQEEFFDIIESSPAFERPYDRDRMCEYYKTVEDRPQEHIYANVKAHGLIYRHSLYELCGDVADDIRMLRNKITPLYAPK